MANTEKPWPESPPILRERGIIQRGLQFYFSCRMCKELGWNLFCEGKENCSYFLYQKLEEHFQRWQSVKNHAAKSVQR